MPTGTCRRDPRDETLTPAKASVAFPEETLCFVLPLPRPPPSPRLLSLVTNVAVGVLYGWTFARHGLKYAMVAHAGTHLLVVLAQTAVA